MSASPRRTPNRDDRRRLSPNRRGKAVLNLATLLARSSGEDIVVCVVAHTAWLPGLVREDAAYQSQIDDMMDGALAQARSELPPDVSATFTTVKARSTPTGLLEAAEQHKASLIAVGSSAAGLFGHIALSSVADRLLHSSHVPVALAPRGFRAGDSKVARVTVAYTGTKQCDPLLRTAAVLVSRLGATMRLASFAVQHAPPVTAMFRTESAEVVAEWSSSIQAAASRRPGRRLRCRHRSRQRLGGGTLRRRVERRRSAGNRIQ